ncbi:MAG: ATP12 family protein [Pseudomonadota bacterium]
MTNSPNDPGSASQRASDPYALARKQAEAERPKRFYKTVSIEAVPHGFELQLDGRPLRSPAKAPIIVPRSQIADTLAAEWGSQGDYIVPGAMPVTRIVNTALDGVSQERDAVAAQTASFILSDLVCYRAEHPTALVALQAKAWDPVIAHIEQATGSVMKTATGIIAVEQDTGLQQIVRERLLPLDDFALAGAASIVTLTGSAGLLIALLDGALDGDAVWAAAHVDEDWNIAQWGEDAEATERRVQRRREFDAAILLLDR